ncbi:MAG: alpha-amylase family glycosyl hydrolase [Micavibrio sp.]
MENRDTAQAAPIYQGRPTEVIYQIYPATFCDSNNDGHGDLQGIISKLDYVRALNVDAIWLSPIYPSPSGPEGDGGYAVTDRRAINPDYGSMEDFRQLLCEAHKRNLRVYMDDVLPHTSDRHEWFKASVRREEPYKDFYIWHDGHIVDGERRPPNNWLSVFGGGAWEWNDERQQYYLHHFLKSQPALDLNNTVVQDAVLADMKFWLDMGVDGFRYDSLSYANYDPQFRDNPWMNDGRGWDSQYFAYSHCQPQTVELVARIRQLMDSYPDKKTTLGEVICGQEGGRNPMPLAARYVDRARGLDMCYTDAFRAIQYNTGHKYLQDLLRGFFTNFPEGGHCNALSNHDSPRMATHVGAQVPEAYREQALRQLMRLMAVLPGSLSLYQGEELGLPDAVVPRDIPHDRIKDPVAATKGVEYCRDGSRTPMPWHSGSRNGGFTASETSYLPVADEHYHLAVNKQSQDPGSTLNFMKALLSWRQQQPALVQKSGNLSLVWQQQAQAAPRAEGFVNENAGQVLPTMAPILAFTRRSPEQTLLCVFNISSQSTMFKPADLLDQTTLNALGLSPDEIMRLPAYGSDFRGTMPPQQPTPNPAPCVKPACVCT